MKLRDYQERAIAEVRTALRTVRRVVLVAPTGAGKTVVAGEIIRLSQARDTRRPVVFLAHRSEIIEQTSKKLDALGIDHGILQSDHWRSRAWCPVQIASVPTLARRLDRLPQAAMVIHDEAHHANAASFLSVLKAYPEAVVIGMTATPYRLDGQGLGNLDGQGWGFESIVCVAQIHELIERGYLVPPRIFAPPGADLSNVHTVAGDYNMAEAAEILNRPKLVGDIVEHWKKHAAGRLTLCFASRIDHSKAIVAKFLEAGIPAEHVDATSGAERAAALKRFSARETLVLSNVGLFTEGTDIPECSAMISARPTQSPSLWRQMCGRPLRTLADDVGKPRETWRKPDAVILDHVGNTQRHGLPTAPETYTLLGREKRSRDAVPSVTVCSVCFAAYDSSLDRCPACGAERPVKKRGGLEHEAGELEEVKPSPAQVYGQKADGVERGRLLAKWTAEGRLKGWKPGAAKARFKGMFGTWPTAGDDAVAREMEFPRFLVPGGVCKYCASDGFEPRNGIGHCYIWIDCAVCGKHNAGIQPESPFWSTAIDWRESIRRADIALDEQALRASEPNP